MTKKLAIIILIVCALAVACKNRKRRNVTGLWKPGQTEPFRDRSINKANAYNDIFLDSNDVEAFIVSEKLNDTLSEAVREFYDARNYEFAWFASTGLIEQAYSFHSLYRTDNNNNAFDKSLEKQLDRIRLERDTTINSKEKGIIKTELQITRKFIEYAIENNLCADVSPANLATYIPAKKYPANDLADSMLAVNDDNKRYESLSSAYRLLKVQLKKYYDITKRGGWQPITGDAKKYTVGMTAPAIVLIKKRLQATGELPGADTSAVFTPELENAVKTYQVNHGEAATGVVNAAWIANMNVSAAARMQLILINMQRMRWMPSQPEGKLIIVNIPEFELYVDSAKTHLFHMAVVVGAEGHNTTMFSGKMNQIVFSPYWDIPPSIVKKEILPAISKDKHYLDKKDMEITGNEGGLPVIRQRPGEKNALGRVKFLFPNSFNIYLHDSPEKALFSRSERNLSHGCIRLSDPVKMAHYLLAGSKTWPPEKIDSAMDSGVEQTARLKPTVPVVITYYTAWVDENGALHFVDDIYGHDKNMAAKMFTK